MEYYDGTNWVTYTNSIAQGPPGTNGSTWLTGSNNPVSSEGVLNDFYLNSTTGEYYKKTSTSNWTIQGSLKGPQSETNKIIHGNWLKNTSGIHQFIVPDGVNFLKIELTGSFGGRGETLISPCDEDAGKEGGRALTVAYFLYVQKNDLLEFSIGINGSDLPAREKFKDCPIAKGKRGNDGSPTEIKYNGILICTIKGGDGGDGATITNTSEQFWFTGNNGILEENILSINESGFFNISSKINEKNNTIPSVFIRY
jgi:hypothetical protein